MKTTMCWCIIKDCDQKYTNVSSPFFSFFSTSTSPITTGILSSLSPIIPSFSTQSTDPLHTEGTCSLILLLLVNVLSSFFTVVVSGWFKRWASEGVTHLMVGAGLPVAEQLISTSTSSSSSPSSSLGSTCVLTSEIPSWREENSWSLRRLELLYPKLLMTDLMLSEIKSVFSLYLAQWDKSASFVTPQGKLENCKHSSLHRPTSHFL